MKKSFIVTFRADCRYKVVVDADVASDNLLQITEEELEHIEDLADTEFCEADTGELEVVDSYARMIEDYDTGNIVWDRE